MPKEFDLLVNKVKASLRKAHPDWDEKRVSSAAFGTATKLFKDKAGTSPQESKSEDTMAEVIETKSYHFSDSIEVKDAFVSGVISSTNEDLGNDTLSIECLKQLADTINSGGVALGFEHTEVLGGRPNILPIGKLNDAEINEGKLLARGILNEDASVFNQVKNSIEKGFLNAFSIEYQVDPDKTLVSVDGKGHRRRTIGGMKGFPGVALTGRPMNTDSFIEFQFKHADVSFGDLDEKAVLTSQARANLPTSAFVFPKERRFPIHDLCLSGDTKIPLLDGREVPIKDLEGQEVWVYSFDVNKMAIVPAKATNIRKTFDAVETFEVVLDNGESVICTPDHPLMLRNGAFQLAGRLKNNVSLMPLYRKKTKFKSRDGERMSHYEQIYQPHYRYWEFTHHMVCRESGNIINEDSVVHHIDEKHINNIPENLELMNRAEHCKFHGGKFLKSNPKQVNEWRRKASKSRWSKPGAREKQAQVMIRENARRKELTEQYLNHTVVDVRPYGTIPVYDMSVPGYENFAVSQGIFVHNSHARNALARVSQFGSPAEKSKVQAAVFRKFPELRERREEREVKSEVKEMAEEEKPVEAPAKEKEEPKKEEAQPKEEEKKEEKVEKKSEEESKEEEKVEAKIDVKALVKEMVAAMPASKEAITATEVKSAEDADVQAYMDGVLGNKASIEEQWRLARKIEAKRFPNQAALFDGARHVRTRGKDFFEVKGEFSNEIVFEVKALEHDTNKQENTFYYQNAAELNDIYDPVVINTLNDKTTLYGLLRKVNASGFADRYGARLLTVRNASATNYDEGDSITAGNTTRLKVQLPFVWYNASVQVTGQMIAAARGRGGIGDVFGIEVSDATRALLKKLNQDLFDTSSPSSGATTGGQMLALDYLVDDGGAHSTLYGYDRSVQTQLQGNDEALNGSPRISKEQLRKMIRTSEEQGSNRKNLIFVCDHQQRDFILGLMDDAQRIANSTLFRAGFEGLPTFDGVAIHADVDCTAGRVYLLDMEATFFAMQVAPTFEDLAKTDDSKKGFIKTYLALFCTGPKRNYKTTGLATS